MNEEKTTMEPAEAAADLKDGQAEAPEMWRVSLDKVLNSIAKGSYIPIPSNIPFIDDLTGGGFVPGTVTVITADPGAGKTALCQQMAAQFARNAHKVTFINYEMDEGLLFARDLAREVKPSKNSVLPYDPTITAPSILRGYLSEERGRVAADKLQRFNEAVEDYRAHVYPYLYYKSFVYDYDDNGKPQGIPRPIKNTVEDLRSLTRVNLEAYEARKEAARKAYEAGESKQRPEMVHAAILFIDYVQLIAGSSDNKINNLEEITGILTEYAQAGNTIVFAVSSANRDSRKGAGKERDKQAKDDEEEGGVQYLDDERAKDGKPGQPVLIYIDKARLANPKKLVNVRFIGSVSKFIPQDSAKPREPSKSEKQRVLTMTSASGASVLEYSASYFISLNWDVVKPRPRGPYDGMIKALISPPEELTGAEG